MIRETDHKMWWEDCRAIHERMADWLVKDCGDFEQKKEKGVEIVKTAKGSEYAYYLDGTTFIASFQKNLSDKRRILLVSHYMVLGSNTTCSIGAEFSEPDTVERWELSPDEKKQLNEITKGRSEEHTSELQSLMRISYAVFCLKKKKKKEPKTQKENSNTHI